jgi:predicted  nucleic acid-binding Zn-ribbon protein
MHADLERLIRLQQIDTFTENARRRIADHPSLVQSLDARLASATEGLEAARARLTGNQASRRGAEKDLAMVQSRLSKFKDQLMEVKTNKEYQAVLKEIEGAQNEVRHLEDRILEHMIEADDLGARMKEAESRLAADKGVIAAERARLEEETARLQVEVDEAVGRRAQLVAELPAPVLSTYDTVARGRRGLAVVEARGGYCTACHVRLRPQMYNELLRNDDIVQCSSCQRILYSAPRTPAESEPAAGADE